MSYPDQQFGQFLLRGIRDGFRIGARELGGRQSSKRNLQSAYEHPQIIRDYLAREESLGRIHRLSPQDLSTLPLIQVNPFGVIPKRHRPNKWRLIVDLSLPTGKSVNDAIDRDLCSIAYMSIDNAVSFIQALGPVCLLAKLDLSEAYRAVSANPPPGPSAASNVIGGGHLIGWCSPLWPLLRAQDFFGPGGWIDVDSTLQKSGLGSSLSG